MTLLFAARAAESNEFSGLLIGLLVNAFFWGFIAGWVGSKYRNRFEAGFVNGFLFGPFGIAFAFMLDDYRPTCPKCRAIVPNIAATRCCHCAADMPTGPLCHKATLGNRPRSATAALNPDPWPTEEIPDPASHLAKKPPIIGDIPDDWLMDPSKQRNGGAK